MPKSRLLVSSLLSPLSKSLHVIDMGFPNNFKYNAIQAHRWGNSKLFLINHLLSLDSFFLSWDQRTTSRQVYRNFVPYKKIFGSHIHLCQQNFCNNQQLNC